MQDNVRHRIHLFASWTVIIGLLISIWTTVNALTGEYRVSGPFNNPNLYADYLIFTLFMFCIILDDFPVSNRYTKAFLSIGFLFPITISLFATESRAGLGALFLGILFYVSMNQEFQKKLNLSHIFTLVPGLVFIMYHATRYLSPGTISRFQLVLAGEDTGGRFTRWRSAVEVLVNSPIFGVGWGQHQEYVGSFYELHNTVLQVSVDAGIVGGLLFIAILIRGIRSSIQWSGRPTYVGSAAMGSFLTASISFSIFHNTLNFRTFWIVLAMIGSAELYYYKNHV
jgi:O-antigen ligase